MRSMSEVRLLDGGAVTCGRLFIPSGVCRRRFSLSLQGASSGSARSVRRSLCSTTLSRRRQRSKGIQAPTGAFDAKLRRLAEHPAHPQPSGLTDAAPSSSTAYPNAGLAQLNLVRGIYSSAIQVVRSTFAPPARLRCPTLHFARSAPLIRTARRAGTEALFKLSS